MKKLLVVVKEPGKRAVQKVIPNTLEAFQEEVGGYIETVRVTSDVLAIVNEEGRLMGLPENFSGLVGNVVLCSDDGEEFAGLDQHTADMLVEVLGE